MKPQNIALLQLLRQRPNVGVTALDAFQEIGTFRLAARVADLRADGFDVWTDLVTTEGGKRIAVYRLREKPRQLTLTLEERRESNRADVLEANNPIHWEVPA